MKNQNEGCQRATTVEGVIRTFDTGATRDTDHGKLDYEAFLSPLALKRYAEYMHKHRRQPDGTLREGDNWQKGIPLKQYLKSWWRHFFDCWAAHRSGDDFTEQQEENLCAALFNNFGLLHEILKSKKRDTDAVRAFVADAEFDAKIRKAREEHAAVIQNPGCFASSKTPTPDYIAASGTPKPAR